MIPSYWQPDVQGASLVSIKVGGVIKYVARPRTDKELQETLSVIQELNLPYRALGGGSDLVLPDEGFAGVLVQPKYTAIEVGEQTTGESTEVVVARYTPEAHPEFLQPIRSLVDLTDRKCIELVVGAGVPWGQLVMESLRRELGGLHFFARIPCYVGGAVYNNIHAGTVFFSDYIRKVEAFDPTTATFHMFSQQECQLGYDQSVFHRNRMIITRVHLVLPRVNSEESVLLRTSYLDLTKEKTRVQPAGANSGSTFKNLDATQLEHSREHSVAAAWYIDQCGLKGMHIGGMQVYLGHANFIINTGTGTQADFIALVEQVRVQVYGRYGFWLQPEVECMDTQGNLHQWQMNQ